MQTNLPRPVDEPNDDVNTVPNSTELRRRRRAFFEDGASSPRRSPRLNAGLSAADNSPPLAAVDDTSDVDDDSSAMEGGLVEEDGREPDEAEPETATETGQIADPEPGKVEQEPQGLAEEPIKDNAGPQGTDEDETKLCRICFGGLEEEAELGRLFSPCKCKGSMRYVHVNCLNQWRQRANKKEAFYRCDQCLYKYSFSRTWWAQLVTNERG